MTSPSVLWRERDNRIPGRTLRVLALCVGLAWALLIAERVSQPPPFRPFECSSDPWDFLPVGAVEPSTLVFLVEAHCANAKYMPDGWIELRYGGARFDVELRRVDIVGAPVYLQVVSIGGVATP